MPTDFPNKGDDKKISLRNSKFPQYDFNHAMQVKTGSPKLWAKGGNEFGNTAFRLWEKARAGDTSASVQNWIVRRERFMERHFRNHRIAGVIAVIKWGGIVEKGPGFMKNLIKEEQQKTMLKKYDPDKLKAQRQQLSETLGISIQKNRGVSIPPGFSNRVSDYGDPVNLSYPLNPPQRLRNAGTLFELQKSRYTEDEQRKIAQRIMNAEIERGIETTADLIKSAGLSGKVKPTQINARFKKSKTQAGKVSSLLVQTDEQVMTAAMTTSMELTKSYHPDMFGISDWESYAAGFQERYGKSMEQVLDIVKSSNAPGFHDHSVNPMGLHRHSPTDQLDGAHEHTADNPYGLHKHNENDRLSGSHTHPMGGTGEHYHEQIMDGPSVYDGSTHSDLEKALLHLQLKKSIDNIAEVVAFCLVQQLNFFCDDFHYIARYAIRKSKDRGFIKMVNELYGILASVRSDLRFLTFEAGRLVDAPRDTEDNMVDIEKSMEAGVRRACNYDIRRVNQMRQQLMRVQKVTAAMLEIYPEDEAFDDFRMKLVAMYDQVDNLLEDYPSFAARLHESGIYNLADTVVMRNGDDEPEEKLDFTSETPLIKSTGNSEGGEEAAFFNKSVTMAEAEYAEFVKSNNINTSTYRVHNLELTQVLQKAVGNGKKKFEGRVLGIVLRPGSPDDRDAQGHWMTAETIQAACYYWAANHMLIGYEHKKYNKQGPIKDPDVRILQNAIAFEDIVFPNGRIIPKGSWYQELLLVNPKYKAMAEKGLLKGLSIKGPGKIVPDAA